MKWSHLLFFLCLFCSSVLAVGPSTIPYQGFITDSAGIPVNATPSMQFELFDAEEGGNSLWLESHNSVSVVQGIFDVQLGSITLFPEGLFEGRLFLGIRIDGDTEMVPRVKIGSVPFSFTSGRVSACGSGITNCDGTCVNLQSDKGNCGLCENQCDIGDYCDRGTCLFDMCTDGIQNGEETDVDCGGNNFNCARCNLDDHCSQDSDCQSGRCSILSRVCI